MEIEYKITHMRAGVDWTWFYVGYHLIYRLGKNEDYTQIPTSKGTFQLRTDIYEWMNENIGTYGTEWKFLDVRTILVKDKGKASIVKLVWG